MSGKGTSEYLMSLYIEQKAHLFQEHPDVTGSRQVFISSWG